VSGSELLTEEQTEWVGWIGWGIGPQILRRTTGTTRLAFVNLDSTENPSPRKGHWIVSEYVDTIVNKREPTFPWQVSLGPEPSRTWS